MVWLSKSCSFRSLPLDNPLVLLLLGFVQEFQSRQGIHKAYIYNVYTVDHANRTEAKVRLGHCWCRYRPCHSCRWVCDWDGRHYDSLIGRYRLPIQTNSEKNEGGFKMNNIERLA